MNHGRARRADRGQGQGFCTDPCLQIIAWRCYEDIVSQLSEKAVLTVLVIVDLFVGPQLELNCVSVSLERRNTVAD